MGADRGVSGARCCVECRCELRSEAEAGQIALRCWREVPVLGLVRGLGVAECQCTESMLSREQSELACVVVVGVCSSGAPLALAAWGLGELGAALPAARAVHLRLYSALPNGALSPGCPLGFAFASRTSGDSTPKP